MVKAVTDNILIKLTIDKNLIFKLPYSVTFPNLRYIINRIKLPDLVSVLA